MVGTVIKKVGYIFVSILGLVSVAGNAFSASRGDIARATTSATTARATTKTTTARAAANVASRVQNDSTSLSLTRRYSTGALGVRARAGETGGGIIDNTFEGDVTITEKPLELPGSFRMHLDYFVNSATMNAYFALTGGTDEEGNYLLVLPVNNQYPDFEPFVTNLRNENNEFQGVTAVDKNNNETQVYDSAGHFVETPPADSLVKFFARKKSQNIVPPSSGGWGQNTTSCPSAQNTINAWNAKYPTTEDDIKMEDVRYVTSKYGVGSTADDFDYCAIIFRDPDRFCHIAGWSGRSWVAGGPNQGYFNMVMGTTTDYWAGASIINCDKQYSDRSNHRIILNVNAGMKILLTADKMRGRSYTQWINIDYNSNDTNSGISATDNGLPDLTPLITMGQNAGLTFHGVKELSYGHTWPKGGVAADGKNGTSVARNFGTVLWNEDGSVANAERLGQISQGFDGSLSVAADWGITEFPTTGGGAHADSSCNYTEDGKMGGCMDVGYRCNAGKVALSTTGSHNYYGHCVEPCETGLRNEQGCVPTVEYCASIDSRGFPEYYTYKGYPVTDQIDPDRPEVSGVTSARQLFGNCACPVYSLTQAFNYTYPTPACSVNWPGLQGESSDVFETDSTITDSNCKHIDVDETAGGCYRPHGRCKSNYVVYRGVCVQQCPSGQRHVGNIQVNNYVYSADCASESTQCSGKANSHFDENCLNPDGTTDCPAKYCRCDNGYTLINGVCTKLENITCSAGSKTTTCPSAESVDFILGGCVSAGCRCGANQYNKNGTCIDNSVCDPACDKHAHCENKQCVCEEGFQMENGTCLRKCTSHTDCGPGGSCGVNGTCTAVTCDSISATTSTHAVWDSDQMKCVCDAANNYKLNNNNQCVYNMYEGCGYYDNTITIPSDKYEEVAHIFIDSGVIDNDEQLCGRLVRELSSNGTYTDGLYFIYPDNNVPFPIITNGYTEGHIDATMISEPYYIPRLYREGNVTYGINWKEFRIDKVMIARVRNLDPDPDKFKILSELTNPFCPHNDILGVYSVYGDREKVYNVDGSYYNSGGELTCNDNYLDRDYGLFVKWGENDTCGYANAVRDLNCNQNTAGCVDEHWKCVDGWVPFKWQGGCGEAKYINKVKSFVGDADVQEIRVYPADEGTYCHYRRAKPYASARIVVDNTYELDVNIDIFGDESQFLGVGRKAVADGMAADGKGKKIHVTDWEYNHSNILQKLVKISGTQNDTDKYFRITDLRGRWALDEEFFNVVKQDIPKFVGISASKNDGRFVNTCDIEHPHVSACAGLDNVLAKCGTTDQQCWWSYLAYPNGPMYWQIAEPYGGEPNSWTGTSGSWSGEPDYPVSGYAIPQGGSFVAGNIEMADGYPDDYYLVHAQGDDDNATPYVTVYFPASGQNMGPRQYVGSISTHAVMCKAGEDCFAADGSDLAYCFGGQCDYSEWSGYGRLVGWSTTKDSNTVEYQFGANIKDVITNALNNNQKEVVLYPVFEEIFQEL